MSYQKDINPAILINDIYDNYPIFLFYGKTNDLKYEPLIFVSGLDEKQINKYSKLSHEHQLEVLK
jgi:hypothetical protein